MNSRSDTRLHPWIALRSLIEVSQDPEKTEVGAVMVRALEGRSRQRLLDRVAADAMGAQILAEGRRLERTLSDARIMEAFPRDSLGERYWRWSRDEGISVQGLIEAAGYVGPTPERQLMDCRDAATHDLCHVVTGYGRDLLGELAVLHFTLIQTGSTGLILPCWLGLFAPNIGRKGRRLVFEARRRARRAAWMTVADWEALLPRPLSEVRERLRVGPPPEYTPVFR